MARPTRPTGAGQWAMGHREPLNANEQMKKDNDGLDVRARIENIYSKRGFDSIDAADLRGRMRWWGLYTQRAPGIDGGRTALLEPEELDDSYFMMRVRIPGGRLTSEQLRVVAGIATEFGRDVADITDRQNVQYHWIRIEDVPEIWRRLESVGLSSTEACGDTPRNMLGCPLAGIDVDEILDATAVLRRGQRFRRGQQGVLQPAAQVEDRDLRLRLALHGARDQRRLLRRRPPRRRQRRLRPLGRRWPVDQPDVCPPARGFRHRGPGQGRVGRRHVDLPRLRLPPAAHPGSGQVPDGRLGSGEVPRGAREGVPRLRAARRAGGRRRSAPGRATTSASTGRRTASSTSAWRPGWAGSPARMLAQVADLAEQYGEGEIRCTVEQKLVLLGVSEADVEPLVEALEALDLRGPAVGVPPRHDGLHRHRVLQAGDRRDQAAGDGPVHRPREAPARLRPAGVASTSTAAPTPAPGSRSPTSGSRARSSTARRASRSTSAARWVRSTPTPTSAGKCVASR